MSQKPLKDLKTMRPEEFRDREPWDRLPDEHAKAYSAFLIYRNLPQEERTLLKAWRIYQPNSRQKGSPHFTKWAQDHRWEDRAMAWDRHFIRLKDRATEKSFQKDLVEERGKRQTLLSAMNAILSQYYVWVNSSEKTSPKLRALAAATATYLEQSRKEFGDDPLAERQKDEEMEASMENIRAKIQAAINNTINNLPAAAKDDPDTGEYVQ